MQRTPHQHQRREAFTIAHDVLRGLQLLGARVVFVTHLHALAADLATLNQDASESIVSLVAGVDEASDDRRTYRIVKGPPRGSSYAADIAARHGLTWEQLSTTLRRANIGGMRLSPFVRLTSTLTVQMSD